MVGRLMLRQMVTFLSSCTERVHMVIDGCGHAPVQGRGSGVNFALPVDLVREILPNLIVYGSASGKGLG